MVACFGASRLFEAVGLYFLASICAVCLISAQKTQPPHSGVCALSGNYPLSIGKIALVGRFCRNKPFLIFPTFFLSNPYISYSFRFQAFNV